MIVPVYVYMGQVLPQGYIRLMDLPTPGTTLRQQAIKLSQNLPSNDNIDMDEIQLKGILNSTTAVDESIKKVHGILRSGNAPEKINLSA